MLSLPLADRLEPAADRLRAQVADLLDSAYATSFQDGTPATVAHTLRVAIVACPNCFEDVRPFPSGIVSLTERVDRGGVSGWLACPSGHLQHGPTHRRTRCRTCNRSSIQRRATPPVVGSIAVAATPAESGKPGRSAGSRSSSSAPSRPSRNRPAPSERELAASADASWPTQPQLPEISSERD